MIDEFFTLTNNKIIIEEKKSKFISESFQVSNKEDVKKIIDEVKSIYKDATHHVYAYVLLDGISKSCDDKEPAGTAGVQILNVINNFEIKNVLIIITRYFGGIKLGKSGLSRTYSYCAKALVENSKIIKKKLCYEVTVPLTYKEYNKILNRFNFTISNVNFDYDVKVKFVVERERLDEFKYSIKEFTKNADKTNIGELKYVQTNGWDSWTRTSE